MQNLIALLFCMLSSIIFACDVKETEIGACVKDVELYCKVELFPYTVQSIFDSRDCLRKNRDFVSKECLDYLELDKPSIIESCFVEMKTSCSNVVPGCFNVRSCLSGVSVDELSRGCQEALVQDHESTDSEGRIPSSTGSYIALWNSWTKSFTDISHYVFTAFSQVSQGNHVRGSVFVEIIENDKKGTALNDDDFFDESDDDGYLSRLQEWRQEYFKEVKHMN